MLAVKQETPEEIRSNSHKALLCKANQNINTSASLLEKLADGRITLSQRQKE